MAQVRVRYGSGSGFAPNLTRIKSVHCPLPDRYLTHPGQATAAIRDAGGSPASATEGRRDIIGTSVTDDPTAGEPPASQAAVVAYIDRARTTLSTLDF